MDGESAHLQTPQQCSVINSNNMTIMYYNARSLILKYDELCLTMEAHNHALWKLGYVLMFLIAKLPYLDTKYIGETEIGMVEVFSFMLGIILYMQHSSFS